ncbi:Uma2 family endonuclease [Leptodesmis sichuanensis]|uniref:Uma2 family endonuclease n=1 Tax=Leptodesmis sichuanensis TaxID=2906798 RepID=UPI001F433A34|nr:Uma2 family endonuclease [Leptodesmis sichuanensis]UIE37847.1 Uma2 family endonuclease [Leptodesmis sichuanensis A121]
MKSDGPAISELPILESGDRLSRAEFERRYTAMPHLEKAELIEGVVYVASPVRVRKHGNPHSRIITWLGTYEAVTPGVMVCDNTTVRLDLDNEPQPDALLRIEEAWGGQSRISEDDYIEGAPELIVEIAASSASYDLHDKLRAYRRNGVREYLVWLVQEQQFRWYGLQEGEYRLQAPDSAGVLSSQVFPGLHLAVNALLNGEMRQVLAVLQQGINSEAHQAFVQSQLNLQE